jgi:hypothetical protein
LGSFSFVLYGTVAVLIQFIEREQKRLVLCAGRVECVLKKHVEVVEVG